jgi:hypothetical protein
MILYKPTNTLFRNRLEAKLTLGHYRFNQIVKKHPEDLLFIDNQSSATDEQVYSNSQQDNRTKEV